MHNGYVLNPFTTKVNFYIIFYHFYNTCAEYIWNTEGDNFGDEMVN